MNAKAFLGVVCLCLGQTTFAISQVGNGRLVDPTTGFEVDIPAEFSYVDAGTDLRADLRSAPQTVVQYDPTTNQPTVQQLPVDIHVRLFGNEYPAEDSLPNKRSAIRLEIHDYFMNDSNLVWMPFPMRENCVEAFTAESAKDRSGGYQGIALWGNGKGIVIYGDHHERVQRGIRDLLTSLTLASGACAWP